MTVNVFGRSCWTRALGLTMAVALGVTGFRAYAGGVNEKTLDDAKKLVEQFAEAGKLSKTSDAEILLRLEERGYFAGEKGDSTRTAVVAYLEKLRLSKAVQNEPVAKSLPIPAPHYVEAVADISDGAGSVLTPADIQTPWINEAGLGPFRLNPPPAATSKYAEQLILANVGSPSIGFPPAEINQVEVNIRQVSTTQNVVVELKFWDAFNGAAPPGTHCLVGPLGTYTADFGSIPVGASAYPATMNLVPPVVSLDNEVFVEVSYFTSVGGPYALGCTTQFFCGTIAGGGPVNTPQVGASFAGWLMDNNGDSIIDVTEIFDFAAPNNDADFRMHVRAVAPTAESEPNNSVATADNTACGLTLTGTTDPAGDVDYYRFTLTSSALVTADVLCGGGDSTLDLRDSGGAPIESDDDDGAGSCSSITRVLAAGTYILEVRDKGNDEVMPYSIALACSPLAETEPNDTSATADAIACNVTIPGSIGVAGDVDYWTFTLSNEEAVRILLDAGADDSTMSLYDSGLSLVEFDDDGGPGLTSWIGRNLPAGTYYIEARAFSASDTFSYNLAVTCCTPEDVEPNDTAANATPIACGQTVCAGISPAGDADYWALGSFAEQTQVTITVDCAFGDSTVSLRDGTDTEVAFNDDNGIDLCSFLDVLVPPGTYYIRVNEFGNNDQLPYDLSVSCVTVPLVDEVEPNNDSAMANSISCGTPLRGIISSGADVDYWVNTEIVALSLVSVTVTTPTSSLDPTLTILDSSLNPVAFNDDAIGVDSGISYLLFPDTYYFVVDGLSGTGPASTYTLSVTCSAPNTDDQGCISAGYSLGGSIDVAGGSDTFTYIAGAAGTATETVRFLAKSGLVDTNIVVVDNTGALADRDEDDAEGTDAQSYFAADVTKTYTVYVSAGYGQTGGYTLSCEFVRPPSAVETEPNNSIAQTDDIAHFDRLLGTISSAGDVDFFRFFAGVGDVVTVRNLTASGNDNTPNPARDLQVEILDGSGSVIAVDDDGEEDFDSLITNFILPASAGFVYYIKVSNVSGPGDYDLSFRFDNIPFTMSPNVGPKLAVGAQVRAAFTAINPSLNRRIFFKVERLVGGVPTLLIDRPNLNAPAGLNKTKPNVLIDTVPNLPSGTVVRYRATGTVNGRPVNKVFDVIVQ